MFDEQRVDVICMHVIVAEYTTSTTTVLDKDQWRGGEGIPTAAGRQR